MLIFTPKKIGLYNSLLLQKPSYGKKIYRKYYMGDGCHRLSCIIWLNKCDYGIYNVVNSGSVTAREVIEKINKNPALSKSFDFFKTEKEFYKFGAKAPRSNCILDNSKLISSGINIRHVHEALEKSIENWKKQ